MEFTEGTITLELPPPLSLNNKNADAIMFQKDGLLYTGYCDLTPKEDPFYPGKLWYRIEYCMCHGLIEDQESMQMALIRLEYMGNTP